MKNIRITITMTEKEAEWLEQACFVEEEFEHSKFLNHVSNLARRARHAFQQSVQPTPRGRGDFARSRVRKNKSVLPAKSG